MTSRIGKLSVSERERFYKSYAAYENHYERMKDKYAMAPKLSRESYYDATQIVRVEAKSAKNVALSIAKAQREVDYKVAVEVRRKMKEQGLNPPPMRALLKYNQMTYTVNGKEKKAVSVRQSLYMNLTMQYGVDFANESFGY